MIWKPYLSLQIGELKIEKGCILREMATLQKRMHECFKCWMDQRKYISKAFKMTFFFYLISITLTDAIKSIIYIYEPRCTVSFVRKGYIHLLISDVKITNSKINSNYLYLSSTRFILSCKHYITCIGYMFSWRKMHLV